MKKRITTALICIMVINLLGCMSNKHADAKESLNNTVLLGDSEKNAQKEMPNAGRTEAEALDRTYVEGLNKFANFLFHKLESGENVLISPYCVSMALSMLYNSTDKNTRTEMADMLGFNLLNDYTGEYSAGSNQYLNENAKILMDSLKNADPNATISLGNSIWISRDAQLKESAQTAFLEPLRKYYNSKIRKVDFTQGETLDYVNEWVYENTEGMIDPFIKEFKNKETLRLLLVNAIYFNGKWSKPFSKADTQSKVFKGTEKESIVDMMHFYNGQYRYYEENGVRGVEIPYGSERLVMDVILPEDAQNSKISDVYGSHFLDKLDQAKKQEINTLAIPKFQLEYGLAELNNILMSLGMKEAFDQSKANLGLIGDDLYVSMVGHKAKIQVEEWGTMASAATEIEINKRMISDPVSFIADVPFVFYIRDKQTGIILFMGEMNNMK